MRQLILFFASAAMLTGFFLLKPNSKWFNERIIDYYAEFPAQYKNMSFNHRMSARFNSYYTVTRRIASDLMQKSNSENALVLVPSTAYFKARGVEYRVPEPVVFYYFTKVRTAWPNSPQAAKANWYVYVQDGKIRVDSISDQKSFMDSLAVFNQFEISL